MIKPICVTEAAKQEQLSLNLMNPISFDRNPEHMSPVTDLYAQEKDIMQTS